MPSLFLTSTELENVRNWRYSVDDRSISTQLLTPYWNYMLSWVPNTVAPNVLTLTGFICILHSFWLTSTLLSTYPAMVACINALLLFSYQTLDALDGKHARVTKNSSPVGELFDHACDTLGVVFMGVSFLTTLGITSLPVQWICVNGGQLVFILAHLMAMRKKVVEFPRWVGPGEILTASCVMYLMCGLFGFQLSNWLPNEVTLTRGLFAVYLIIHAILFREAALNEYSTRNGIMFVMLYRGVAAFISYYLHANPITQQDVFCDAMFWSIVLADVVVAKMAKRELHPLVVVFAMVSVFNNWLVLAMVTFYMFSVFYELSHYLNLPMFQVVQNVYVDGVFDMCHVGHRNLFKNALQYGNRLIVGVLSDADVAKYKRQPYMSLPERCDAVSACKDVSEVVEGSPATGLTEEFLNSYNIHVVAHSPEYNTPEDHYYTVPRRLGITRVLRRTTGMSTSELIRRIQNREESKSGSDVVEAGPDEMNSSTNSEPVMAKEPGVVEMKEMSSKNVKQD